jgi:uncharacterized protein YkwD
MLMVPRYPAAIGADLVHQPRRHQTRLAGLLLCGLVVVGLLSGMAGAVQSASGSTSDAADDSAVAAESSGLDDGARVIFGALNRMRARSELPELELDETLVDSAERDACAIARGELPLSGDEGRLAEAGGQRENVGMVVETDPTTGARAMHEWWTQTDEHRVDRMDPRMHRYGIGVCTNEERTYYVERFAF